MLPPPFSARARAKPASTGSSDRKYSSIDTRSAKGASACGKPNASCGLCDRGTNPHPDTNRTTHTRTPAALANTRLVISNFPWLEHPGAGGNTAARALRRRRKHGSWSAAARAEARRPEVGAVPDTGRPYLVPGAHSLILPRLITGPTRLGGLTRLAGVAPRRRRRVRSPTVLIEGRVHHQIREHLLSRGQRVLAQIPHRPVRRTAPRLIMKRRPSIGEIIHLELPTIGRITTAEHKRPILLHSSPCPFVRQTRQLLGSDLINIRISHRHHIQSLTAERPPPLLTRTPIPTITDEPKRGHSDSPPALLRQSTGKTRQHRLLRPQILLNRHTLSKRRLRLRQTQRLLRTLRPRNEPTPRHQQNHTHKNTSSPGEHTATHFALPRYSH